jgi:hypothetical protein
MPPAISEADTIERPAACWHLVDGLIFACTVAIPKDLAIELANGVRYGLHAAIFTESLRDAFTAIRPA